MTPKKLLLISRPRFWIYVLGPYLLGISPLLKNLLFNHAQAPLPVLFFALFFSFPANLLIYGINDLYDYETDKLNPKKQEYEELVTPSEQHQLRISITLITLPFLVFLTKTSLQAQFLMVGFLFFSIFYSAEPIRAKAKPFLDSIFNILYIFPGLFGYALIGGSTWSWQLPLAAACWCMAMHAYSAVPDIKADQSQQLQTIATTLGKNGTLLLCAALYLCSALLASSFITITGSIVAIFCYEVLILRSAQTKTEEELFAIYKLFPVINTLFGFGLFLLALR